MTALLDQFAARTHPIGVAVCNHHQVVAASSGLSQDLRAHAESLAAGLDGGVRLAALVGRGQRLAAYVQPLGTSATLVI
jgi:hypothetical protein